MTPTQAHSLVRGVTGAIVGALLATSPDALQKLEAFHQLHSDLAAGLAHTLAHGRHGPECDDCQRARRALDQWIEANPTPKEGAA